LVQNQKWMVMHLLPCYWFQSPQTQRMVVHEIDLVGKTISSFNKAQQNMHNVAVCSPKPCMCCKNRRTFKITLDHKTNEMTETSTLPKLQSFLTSISGWFEYIATRWRAYLEANQLWTCFPSCENMSWKLFTRGITDCPRNGEETDAGNAGTAAGYLDLPDGRGRGWACNMVIHFDLKQFLFQIFVVASF
jgi:hypothetical protein